MNRQPSLVLVALVVICASGCATLAHGLRQTIQIASEPCGARVLLDEKPAGVTPVSVTVWRHNSPTLRIEKDGFVTEVVRPKRSASGWLAADVGVCLNPMNMQGMDSPTQYPEYAAGCAAEMVGIDLITGAAFKFPKEVHVTLTPVVPFADRK